MPADAKKKSKRFIPEYSSLLLIPYPSELEQLNAFTLADALLKS